jgi:hypothetical protein
VATFILIRRLNATVGDFLNMLLPCGGLGPPIASPTLKAFGRTDPAAPQLVEEHPERKDLTSRA